MRHTTLSDAGFDKFRNKTRKERVLDDMEKIIPWKDLTEAIEPIYPKPMGVGRRPIGIEWMLRIHFLRHWFNLPDPSENGLKVNWGTIMDASIIDTPKSTKTGRRSGTRRCNPRAEAHR